MLNVPVITHLLQFPPVQNILPDGLLAIGGDLSTERLLLAYRNGIFPWYEEGLPVMWYCPDPRFVLFPEDYKISKSLKPLLKKRTFTCTVNTVFERVIHHCKTINRSGQQGTWITNEIEQAYIRLYHMGYAHSYEVWQGLQLVGGLYGIRLGNVFFGESMFSKVSNASRMAFYHLINTQSLTGLQMVDCQVHTPYLESMGAAFIDGDTFQQLLKKYIS